MNVEDGGIDDDFMATMLGEFLDESRGYLSNLNSNLLTLDELVSEAVDGTAVAIDPELLNEMFRDAHSLKGLSAMLQMSDINGLTHRIENVFDAARKANLTITRNTVDLMFQALDRLTGMVDHLSTESSETVEHQSVVDEIEKLLDESSDVAAIEDEPDIPERHLLIFVDEALEVLDSMTEALVGDEPVRAGILLARCHQIKGGAASIGLHRAAKILHLTEDLLQDAESAEGTITPECVDPLLSAIDGLRKFVERIAAGKPNADGFEEACRGLELSRSEVNAIAEAWTCPTDEACDDPDEAPDDPDETNASDRSGDATETEDVSSTDGDLDVIGADEPTETVGRPDAVAQEAIELTESVDARETVEVQEPIEVQEPVQVSKTVQVPGPVGRDAKPKVVPEAPPKVRSNVSGNARVDTATPGAASRGKPVETLRVDVERLDQLMNLTGQLVINKARFGRLLDQFRSATSRKQAAQRVVNMRGVMRRLLDESAGNVREGGVDRLSGCVESNVRQLMAELEAIEQDVQQWTAMRSLVNDCSEAMHQLERVSDGIQKCVMDTRMLPIGLLFSRFHRVVRDISRGNGKDVSLVVRGEKTELDKRMIDELGDPLIHMVRNAADHGIETPEERMSVGKPAQGTVTLQAMHRGNRIIIEVRDDGRGLDPAKLRAKAVERGIVSRADADRMSDKQAFQLIWEPGFSTAEAVTEISGRGMGMDIVRSKIEHLSGTIELESEPGDGTTVTIKLPLTMAILPSLLTTVLGDVFAIPVESVTEIVRVSAKDLRPVHGLMTACIRDRILSVVALPELLRWKGTPAVCSPRDETTRDETTIVIVGSEGSEIGIVVDRLLGEEDIVIKSLAENYRSVNGFAGASILGDGKVALILDVAGILAMAGQRACSVVSKGPRAADTRAVRSGADVAGVGGCDV